MDTIPQGNVVNHGLYTDMETEFDFFNYAGIHRPVVLYSVPKINSIRDVEVSYNFPPEAENFEVVELTWKITYDSIDDSVECYVEMIYPNQFSNAPCHLGGMFMSDP